MKRGVVINQSSNLKNLEREEQNKLKPSRKKEQINTDRHQWNWTQAKKKKRRKINETNAYYSKTLIKLTSA